ncbi:YdeI/OmpD-associated family protein [Pedobacter antarcticus]|uniref:YdeI/OmpD-associated family protein n=1 Tax=Pedobacter antarcticus TaxID=34086 RepID=UPI00292EBE27|nr:YdeI/OmpD-associated family protein [Pedobacter antarcticus]
MEERLTIYPANNNQWREWLALNHLEYKGIWLIYNKKVKGKEPPGLSWSEAVDTALCFGWIDSKKLPIDENKFMQFFSKRRSKSGWSRINKEKIKNLINLGLMTDAGLKTIEVAKRDGSWEALDDVEKLVMPTELALALNKCKNCEVFFTSLSNSIKKSVFYWILSAKKEETKNRRVAEIIRFANEGKLPKQFS